MSSASVWRAGVKRAAAIRLAVFDLDGTLTRSGTSVLHHIGREFGFAAEAARLSDMYSVGRRTNAQVSRAAARRLRGRARDELQQALETLPMVEGIAETVAYLHRLRVRSVISTITFDFAAQYVSHRFGFERFSASVLDWSPDLRATGKVLVALEREDKCCFIEHQCARLGISSAQVLVVGDARSDIPAMKLAGWSVAFNATPEVRALASVSVHSTDLRDVVPHIRHLLDDIP
jgi:phosphoserine phosphatase